jgi:translocation and assembly module TamA
MRGAIFLLFVCVLGCSAPNKMCDQIVVRDGSIDLSYNEKILVCGDKQGPQGWVRVPLTQAEYQLKVLLQNRGYLKPRFERDNDHLNVWLGKLTEISSLEVKGEEDLLDVEYKRKIVGEALTPEKLDEVKSWAEQELRANGFACPQVEVEARAWDGAVIAAINPGQKQTIGNISAEGLDGLDVETLARFQAIEPGQEYDAREVQLTINRMLGDGLFQSANFRATCNKDRVDLKLSTSTGRPRVLRLSVGATTEEFPFARLQFKNSRLDSRGSSYQLILYGSPRNQSAELTSEIYRFPGSRRTFWGPRALLNRDSEIIYEVMRAKVGLDVGRLWDQWHTRFGARVGPTLNYVDTLRGIGPSRTNYVSWEGSLTAMSHSYEYSSRSQSEGWIASFNYRGQRERLGSNLNADLYEVNAKHLWNIGDYNPPGLVLGSRIQAMAIQAGQDNVQLPLDYRIFMGGDRNLRGFPRQSLSNDGFGFLTAVYAGFELRLVEQLPYHLEPFLLVDAARFGDRRMTLDRSLFVSQGAGLRWSSPFGTLRATAAKGRVVDDEGWSQGYPQKWVYFLSFGQEF